MGIVSHRRSDLGAVELAWEQDDLAVTQNIPLPTQFVSKKLLRRFHLYGAPICYYKDTLSVGSGVRHSWLVIPAAPVHGDIRNPSKVQTCLKFYEFF